MESVRKNIIVRSKSFFFDADVVLGIRSAFSYFHIIKQVNFIFKTKTKELLILEDIELNMKYEITYYSKKDERKLKLEKLNNMNYYYTKDVVVWVKGV